TCCSPSVSHHDASISIVLSCHPEERSDEGPAVRQALAPTPRRSPSSSPVIQRSVATKELLFAKREPPRRVNLHRPLLSSRGAQRRRTCCSPSVSHHAASISIVLPCHPEERSDEGPAARQA